MDWERGRKIFVWVLVFLVCLNIVAWSAVFEISKPSYLKIVFFDVGQGDAIFIQTPQKHQILIDGGSNSKVLEKLSGQMPFYDRTIDLIILTHPDLDHIAGLIETLKRYKIDNVLWTGVLRDTPEFKEWENSLKNQKLKSKIAKAGQRIFAAEAIFDILYPFENLEGKRTENSNNTSIVLKLSFGSTSFLFTGDIDKSVENKLLVRDNSCSVSCQFASLDSDVLKVAHHGSKTSSSEEFIKEVSPEVSVIEVGKDNPYGYPHEETLNNLKKYDIQVLRTDQSGNIKIISNGTNFSILK